MTVYIYLSVEKLVNRGDDKNTTESLLLDLSDLAPINYNETNVFNFFVFRKQKGGAG